MQRRHWLRILGAGGATGALGLPAWTLRAANVRFERDPFRLGVASGYPTSTGVVLWTRLAPQPERPDGGMDPVALEVRWEVFADEAMREPVARGVALARPEHAHAVHVDVDGLRPDRWYWYRFAAGDATSRLARTRTAPAAGALSPLRMVFASCQQYEQGFFSAWKHAAADHPDLIAFLGDYIYESSWGQSHVRKHDAPEPYTLDDYRRRYALYRGDRDLQTAHESCPWVLTWDDHEVDNDYADDRPEDGMAPEPFLQRRAAAYRAWFEHQPVPAWMRPQGAALRIHTRVDWGQMASLHLLDCRQYRSHQACPRRTGGSNVVNPEQCTELVDPARSLLGAAQEAWLEASLAKAPARWNLIGQSTLMAPCDRKAGPERAFWTDGWDGYPAARQRLIDTLVRRQTPNPVVIGGDVHMHWVADLKQDFARADAPVVATEFVGTSITSQGTSQSNVEALLAENPHLRYGRSDRRGYVRLLLDGARLQADLRGVDTVKTPDTDCSTLASFQVDEGRAGARRL